MPNVRSPEAAQWNRFYKTARWQKLRLLQLNRQPMCQMCEEMGRTVKAEVVDHVTPHKGDLSKFWGGPFQSLCRSHHSGAKQVQERSGYLPGADATGRPLDPDHPWNR